MQNAYINRIMIAGTNSGCGKTTVTCALLGALVEANVKAAAFKCGPDYIDPMFHSRVIGVASKNLDMFLTGEEAMRRLFIKNSAGASMSVLEGVMGFYDGLGGNSTKNSSFEIAGALNVPVVLVVDCRGLSMSLGAIVSGFLNFRESGIKGVILNNCKRPLYKLIKPVLEGELPIKVLGYLPPCPEARIDSRHLGLLTAAEIPDLKDKIERLAGLFAENVDIEALTALASSAPPLEYKAAPVIKARFSVRIAIARDSAFCFYYEDSLRLLEELGAELIPFSPISDRSLPEGINGLILGGGYPELYLNEISGNSAMLTSVRRAIMGGLPCIAECGGFLYLGKTLGGKAMAGVIDMHAEMTGHLQNFGYVTLSANEDTMLLDKGESVNAHEFHYSRVSSGSYSLTAQKTSGRQWEAGYCVGSLFALYPHLHLAGNEKIAVKFLRKCGEYRGEI